MACRLTAAGPDIRQCLSPDRYQPATVPERYRGGCGDRTSAQALFCPVNVKSARKRNRRERSAPPVAGVLPFPLSAFLRFLCRRQENTLENQNAEKPGLLWAGYIALILFTFWMYFQSLYGIGLLLGLAVLIVGIAARGRFRSQGRTFAAAHASWQVNTIWIAIVLFLITVIVLLVIFALIGSDPGIESQLDAITQNDGTPGEMLHALWVIPGIKVSVAACLVCSLLSLIWPLKRAIQGILTLYAGREPKNAGGAGVVSVLLAILLQVIPMAVIVLL